MVVVVVTSYSILCLSVCRLSSVFFCLAQPEKSSLPTIIHHHHHHSVTWCFLYRKASVTLPPVPAPKRGSPLPPYPTRS